MHLPLQSWDTRATAFAIVRRDDGAWLVLRHRRLQRICWEVPGGHVEDGETFEAAAVRETREEAGLDVIVGPMAALCVHEWHERRQRRLIAYFLAVPSMPDDRPAVSGDPDILSVDWRDPRALPPDDTSALLRPLINAGSELGDRARGAIFFRAEHRVLADGSIGPVLVDAL